MTWSLLILLDLDILICCLSDYADNHLKDEEWRITSSASVGAILMALVIAFRYLPYRLLYRFFEIFFT